MRELVLVVVCVLGVCSALICPDGRMCEDKNTCCQMPSGDYGCCPLPNAECCADHLHCCYEGTLCDLVHGKCVNKTHTLDWVNKVSAQLSSLPQAVVCPDGVSECPDGCTCCQLPDGSWGCCPMPNAVCCADKLHCCPQGTTCDLAHSKCVSPTLGSTPLWRKLPARQRAKADAAVKDASVKTTDSNDVDCPDHFSTCPDGTTCCSLGNGSYGCCPMPKAVCCSDHMHCCPEGTTCDLVRMTCVSANEAVLLLKPSGESVPQPNIKCDASSTCPDGTTCCKMLSGAWGCCPLPQAVCCADRIHCCPQGTLCNVAAGTCDGSSDSGTPLSVPWVVKTPALTMLQTSGESVPQPNIKCDASSTCPDGTTCCKMLSGAWGCCPLPQAVCCADRIHCCPQGTLCNVGAGTCDGSSDSGTPLSVPWVVKTPALPMLQTSGESVPQPNIKCDASSTCPDGTTCCKMLSGAWGCCPLPQAVCCADRVHCCPQGTLCNVAAGTCDSTSDSGTPLSVPWAIKMPALTMAQTSGESVPQPNIKCDASSTCPDGTTCCKMLSGAWGCCPLPQAVCCADRIHCCPQGTLCNVAAGTCDSSSDSGSVLSVPWVVKTPALTLPLKNSHCDETSLCPTGTTCCKQNSGDWACCPLPQAVCCDDHEHCCPQGYKCDVAHESCEHPYLPSMPLFRKQAALSMTLHSDTNTKAEKVVSLEHKCDAQTSCPRDNTCCFMVKFNKWGCCPLPQAVCCEDGDHCCPSGFTCDRRKPTCIKGHLEIPWFTKQEAGVSQWSDVTLGVQDVKCDPTTSCAAGSTCCRLSTGQWGCCPLVKAVCCEDREHCCPQGYTCDLQSGTCVHPFAVHTVALQLTPPHSEEEVSCDAGSRCSGTCCKISDLEWACCPFKKGVCCKDMKRCCPEGYVCDPKARSCTKSSSLTWWDNTL